MAFEEFNKNGWIPDEKGVQKLTVQQDHYAQTIQEVEKLCNDDDDSDRFWFQQFGKAFPNLVRNGQVTALNQGNVGSCVGNADARMKTVVGVLDVMVRKQAEKIFDAHISAEYAYAIGREVSGQLGSWDGSTNSWVIKGATEVGSVLMIDYPGIVNLSTYSASRCSEWARRGTPQELRPKAEKFQTLKYYRVRNAQEWWSMLGAGYAINLCSSWGGSGSRDADGVMAKRGSWGHSMCSYWRKKHARRGRLFGVQNSWGDSWASGPYPDLMPWGSFYITEADANWICQTGEVLATADVEQGFKPDYEWGNGAGWNDLLALAG